jgi:hypothetical protein
MICKALSVFFYRIYIIGIPLQSTVQYRIYWILFILLQETRVHWTIPWYGLNVINTFILANAGVIYILLGRVATV